MKKILRRMNDVTVTLFSGLVNLIKKWRTKPQLDIALLDLSPHYDPRVHRIYVDMLEDALRSKGKDGSRAKNIALSGSYGVGKSSILDEVRRRHKKQTISISLAILTPPNRKTASDTSTTTTNILQKEIIKQILYSEHPANMPGSQYRRVAKVQAWRMLGHSITIGFALTFVFFVVGWAASIQSLIAPIPYVGNSIYITLAICWIVLAILSFWVLQVIHNRFRIEQLSVDKAGFTLSAGTTTYFDKYLDEIVYFFEIAKKCDIVIFEDIDRFGDHEIFETLRSLNTILNTAKQLKGRSVRFVYAIKDSIFEPSNSVHDDAAQSEADQANRTKFFDRIIPVVPFVTHTNARNLLDDVMKDIDHSVSSRLIDLVARHVPDMRLIKNIRNEFAIFKNQIIDGGTLNLSQDELFAIVAYKNTHLKDFEQTRLRESDLDTVYQAYRDIVNSSTVAINTLISGYENKLRTLSFSRNKGNIFGTLFVDDVTKTMSRVDGINPTYKYHGNTISSADILTDELWAKIAESKSAITVNYRTRYSPGSSFDVTHDELVKIVGSPLDVAMWEKSQRQELNRLIGDAKEDVEFLKTANMRDLFNHPKFKQDEKSFGDILNDTLKSELANELVREGYIDRNFTLYMSVFNGTRVSGNAMNFIMKHIDTGVADASFRLKDNDIKSILRERPDVINQKTAYNISLIDYLLVTDSKSSNKVISQLIQDGTKDREFINTYLESGSRQQEFIEALTEQWTSMFTYLTASEVPLADKDRVALIDNALRSINSSITYKTDVALQSFVQNNYTELNVLRSTKTTSDQAIAIAELMNLARIKLDNIKPLAEKVRSAVVSVGAYTINRGNILIALGNPRHTLELDAIKATDDTVYDHILDDMPSYLASLEPNEQTIVSRDQFGAIITDALPSSSESIDELISKSDSSCIINTLASIPAEIWPILAMHQRFPVSFENVSAYVAHHGIDNVIAIMLTNSGVISDTKDVDEDAKLPLLEKVLSAREQLPSAELRANIAASLNINGFIANDMVPNEAGELVGWLIDKQVAADGEETFAHIDMGDVEGLLFAISKSTEFKNFMTTTEVTTQNVGVILRSNIVPVAVKNVITKNFSNFTNGASKEVLEAAAQYAVDSSTTLLPENIARLANEGVNAGIVVLLLGPHLAEITLVTIAPILTSLGSDYAKLTERSHKIPKFVKDDAHRALLDCMKRLGTVSTVNDKGLQLRAFMKHHA